MLSQKIKEQTAVHHLELEKILIPIIRAIKSQQDYTVVLNLFFGYFNALEEQIANFIPSQLTDYGHRRKAKLIANDLNYLDSPLPTTAQKGQLPEIASSLQALGALYVMEGSTLGGKIIAKMISKQLSLETEALSFFNGYGDATDSMWAVFTGILNESAQNEEEETTIINAANQTFIKFKSYIETAIFLNAI